jgi:hypothetical protein
MATAEGFQEEQRLIAEIRVAASQIEGQKELVRKWRGNGFVADNPIKQTIKNKLDEKDAVFMTVVPAAGSRFGLYPLTNGKALPITMEMSIFNAAHRLANFNLYRVGSELRVSTDADIQAWQEMQTDNRAASLRQEAANSNQGSLHGGLLDLIDNKDLVHAAKLNSK